MKPGVSYPMAYWMRVHDPFQSNSTFVRLDKQPECPTCATTRLEDGEYWAVHPGGGTSLVKVSGDQVLLVGWDDEVSYPRSASYFVQYTPVDTPKVTPHEDGDIPMTITQPAEGHPIAVWVASIALSIAGAVCAILMGLAIYAAPMFCLNFIMWGALFVLLLWSGLVLDSYHSQQAAKKRKDKR